MFYNYEIATILDYGIRLYGLLIPEIIYTILRKIVSKFVSFLNKNIIK